MKISPVLIIFLAFLLNLTGCTPQITPDKGNIQSSYSIADVATYSSIVSCKNEYSNDTDLSREFIEDYCQILDANLRMVLRRNNPNLKYDEANPELVVKTTLQKIGGGNALSLFWFGFGVDSYIATFSVTVVKNGETIAERVITETTPLPILEINNFSNEDAILKDEPVLAKKIGQFVGNPRKYAKDEKKSWDNLLDFGN